MIEQRFNHVNHGAKYNVHSKIERFVERYSQLPETCANTHLHTSAIQRFFNLCLPSSQKRHVILAFPIIKTKPLR